MTETAVLVTPDKLAAARGVRACAVYLGSEFCENLLPAPAQLKKAAALPGRRAVLVTPLLTEPSLKKVELLIKTWPAARGKLEIVANDIGLVHLAAKKYGAKVSLTAGRVLAGMLRNSPDAFVEKFIAEHGIARVETDRAEIAGRFTRFGLPLSFHAPYAVAGLTRFCPWERRWTGGRCRFSCRKGPRPLKSRLLPEPLYLNAAGYFTAGKKPGGRNIDRVVYDPAGKL